MIRTQNQPEKTNELSLNKDMPLKENLICFLFGISSNNDHQLAMSECIPICHVFKFINFKLVLNNISLVCKRWYLLTNFHNGLWMQYCQEYFPRSLNSPQNSTFTVGHAYFDQFNNNLLLAVYEVWNLDQKQSNLQQLVVQLGLKKIQNCISTLERLLGFSTQQCLARICYYRFYFAKRFVLERRTRSKQESVYSNVIEDIPSLIYKWSSFVQAWLNNPMMLSQIRDGIVSEILPYLFETMFNVTVNDGNSDDELTNETIVTYLNHERLSYDVISNILIFPPHNYDMVSVTFDFEREFNQLIQSSQDNADIVDINNTSINKQFGINELGNIESLETNAEIFYHVFKEEETRVFNNEKALLQFLKYNNNNDSNYEGEEELLSNYRQMLNFHQLRRIDEEEIEEPIQVIHKPMSQLDERDIVVALTPYSSISESMNPMDAQVNAKFYQDDEFSEFSDGGSYDVVDLLSSTGSETDSSDDEDLYHSNNHGEIGEEQVCSSDLPFFDSSIYLNNLETLKTDKHVILRFDENSGTDFKTRNSLLGSRDVELDKNELNKLEDLFFSKERNENPIIKKLREDKVLYHLLLVALCRDIGLNAIVN